MNALLKFLLDAAILGAGFVTAVLTGTIAGVLIVKGILYTFGEFSLCPV